MLTRSDSVSPFFGSDTTTSLALPVSVPPGSPLASASAVGPATLFKSASVIGLAGALAADALAEACAEARPGANNAASHTAHRKLVIAPRNFSTRVNIEPSSPFGLRAYPFQISFFRYAPLSILTTPTRADRKPTSATARSPPAPGTLTLITAISHPNIAMIRPAIFTFV